MNKVENTLAKGEIARFEQFLLLSQCFQKSTIKAQLLKCDENIVAKEEIAHY